MQLIKIPPFAVLLSFAVAAALAGYVPGFCPSDDPSCENCLLGCYQACPAPLMVEQCTADCLYCRRESSSCSFVRLDQGPDCDACADSCVCSIGHECNP